MVDKSKILSVGDQGDGGNDVIGQLSGSYDVVEVSNSAQALAELERGSFACVLLHTENVSEQLRGSLQQSERILDGMPDGVVLIDSEQTVFWSNQCIRQWFGPDVIGLNFYQMFGMPELVSNICPFDAAAASHQPQTATLRCHDNRYFHVHAVPMTKPLEGLPSSALIVTVRDITIETLQQQKLAAIHQAGIQLADLTCEEVFHMEVDDRIDLLKANILQFTRDVLNFDVVEIRLLGQDTGALMPLLSVGIEAEAAVRPLVASQVGNGVTGYVAATGKSYLCSDTTKDPLYLEGCKGAKSSMTVPLLLHDQVIGTFNVESPEPHAFSTSDLQFLEIFSRDVAAALNTLELLVAQQANTAQASAEAIHREVALPVDEILNDAVNVMERYIGHEPGVAGRLQRILKNARDIKQLIQKVGQEMAPAEAVPQSVQIPERQLLRRRKVLVVDNDEQVRGAAHRLLERYGCVVETAHEGGEAVFMVRNVGNEQGYDIIIADINLPDMSGFDLLIKLKELLPAVPLVLMKGFGYDPGHAMVKARQAGLHPKGVLYKPFRLDQLLEVCETIVQAYGGPTPPN